MDGVMAGFGVWVERAAVEAVMPGSLREGAASEKGETWPQPSGAHDVFVAIPTTTSAHWGSDPGGCGTRVPYPQTGCQGGAFGPQGPQHSRFDGSADKRAADRVVGCGLVLARLPVEGGRGGRGPEATDMIDQRGRADGANPARGFQPPGVAELPGMGLTWQAGMGFGGRVIDLFDRVAIGLAVVGVDGRFLRVNQALCSMLGYSAEELLQRSCWEVTHPDDQEADRARLERMFQGGVAEAALEKRYLTRDGRLRLGMLTSVLLRDEAGRPAGFLIQIQDFTAHREVEEALRDAIEFSRNLILTMRDGFSVLDPTGVHTEVNPALCRMTGFQAEELLGTGLPHPYWPPEERHAIEAAMERTMRGERGPFDLTFQRKGGERFPVSVSPAVVRDSKGEVIRFTATVRDETERKRSQQQREVLEAQDRLIQKSASLSRMAGAVAHHFNNQLHAVLLNLELAREVVDGSTEGSEAIEEAAEAARRAAGVSRLLLTYLGKTVLNRKTLDLSVACQEALPMLRASLPPSVGLVADLPAPGPQVLADADHLHQILTQLVTNAWEAGSSGPEAVQLAVSILDATRIPTGHTLPVDWAPRERTYASLSVVDLGGGIPPGCIDDLFDPFYSSKGLGRGLGLPVVLGIARAHQGAISVENRPGRGTVFRVLLPLCSDGVTQPSHVVAPAEPAGPGRGVLVVDDEAAVRRVMARMLENLGYRVFQAEDGVEAVEVFRVKGGTIDAVVCDLTMPRMGGWEALEALRRLSPGLPVILASGHPEAEAMNRGTGSERPQGFLGKPFQIAVLDRLLRQVLQDPKGGDGVVASP